MLPLVGNGDVRQLFENGFSSTISLLEEISKVQSSFFTRTDPTKVDLSDSEKYLSFFLGTFEYALFPHARRPNFASALGNNYRDMVWNWVVTKTRNNVGGEQWMHARIPAKSPDLLSYLNRDGELSLSLLYLQRGG